MYILGTAGHVDHGKSALVYALTGIDPDRLPEEKRREMTVDLGFAWLKLPSGRQVSIIDVPGHERFVKNMLAGAGGIDLVLFVIAANEGVMPQSREHLAILDLLNIKTGIMVIAKKDLVDKEWLELVISEAKELVKGTTLNDAPIVAVSAITGEGLPSLISTIDHLLDSTTPREDIGKARLHIDRVFTTKGFGTVVTGTLIDGKLNIGQNVEILPPGLRTSIRGLEMHKQKIDTALPGSRVAANLTKVTLEEIERGMVITTPGWLKPTYLLDAKLRAISTLPCSIKHNMSVTFHTGSHEVAGRIRLLDRERLDPGETGWAQVNLVRPVAVAKGDLFVIRSSQKGTLGGGEIVDTCPKRHRRFQRTIIQSLKSRAEGTSEDLLLAALEASPPSEFEKVILQSHLSEAEAKQALRSLVSKAQVIAVGHEGLHQLLFPYSHWEHLTKEAERLTQNYHRRFPLRRGMPKEELKSQLKIPPSQFDNILQKLVDERVLVDDKTAVRLPSHSIRLSPEQQVKVDVFLKALAQNPYSPPTTLPLEPDLLNLLIEERKMVKAGDGIIFSAPAYEEMLKQVVKHIESRGKITVAEARDLFRTSRRHAVALMEYLDEQKITRRVGNERVLRR